MKHRKKKHPPATGITFVFPTVSVCTLALWLALEPDGATLLTLLAAALHELGHIVAARLLGIGITRITLLPLGADIRFSRVTSYREDIITGGAGAAVNLLSALLLLPLSYNPAVRYFICSSLALCAVNMLPIASLDGGTVLRGLLSDRLPPKTSGIILGAVSAACLTSLWLCSVYLMLSRCVGVELWAISLSVMLGFLSEHDAGDNNRPNNKY